MTQVVSPDSRVQEIAYISVSMSKRRPWILSVRFIRISRINCNMTPFAVIGIIAAALLLADNQASILYLLYYSIGIFFGYKLVRGYMRYSIQPL